MAKRRQGRDVDGILLLDKPAGMSSNQALQRARAIFGARKAGHGGSLDPMATGLLPLCFGEATKFSSYLLGADKGYRATCKLGQTTTSGDAEGEVVDTRPVDVERDRLMQVLADFRGEIEQVPPMYSALKHQGKRLYQLARAGQTVERAPRSVVISQLDLIEFDGERIEIDVTCSKGTYIRSLAEDIGEALGCGAHLTALRRTRVDEFDLDRAISLDSLQQRRDEDASGLDALLLSISAGLHHFPRFDLSPVEGEALCQGRRLPAPAEVTPGVYRLHDAEGRFLGLGEVLEDALLKAKRLVNTGR